MVGTWTFDAANRILTCVGGSLDAPATFNDAYNADITGTRILKAATASPFTASLDTAVAPAESLVLPLSLIITNFLLAGTVQLTGKDAWGNALSETLNITGNGTVVSTLYFGSIDANGVVTAGGFDVAVTQPRWGVVYGFGYYNAGAWGHAGFSQYLLACKLQIGDGSTATYFQEENRQITINSYLFSGYAVTVKNNASFILGREIDATDKTSYAGCSITALCDDGQDMYIWFESGSTGAIYSCYLVKYRYNYYSIAQAIVVGGTPASLKIWNCRGYIISGQNITNMDWYNIETRAVGRGIINQPGTGNTYDKIFAFESTYVYTSDMYRTVIISNLYARGCSKVFSPTNAGDYSHYLMDADIDVWSFNWGSTTGKIYRQYHLDVTVKDKDGAPVEDAAVTLLNNAGAEEFSASTDENGEIAQQLVTYGYYTSASGDTLQANGPFTLQITKTGKMPYTGHIDMGVKRSLVISLREQLSGTADPADVLNCETFYKDDADTKLTGSLLAPAVFVDVASGKSVLNLNRNTPDNCLVLGL